MGLYSLTEIGYMIFDWFSNDKVKCVFWGMIIGIGIILALFILQGVGLYKMAKRLNWKRKYLAFIPFANIIYLGKLVGECQIFGQRMKRAGLYTLLAQIACTLVVCLHLAAELYLYLEHGAPTLQNPHEAAYWGLTGFAGKVETFYEIIPYVTGILELLTQLLFYVLMVGLCKKYAPHNYMFLSLLTLFLPLARFILIFALRNKAPIDYEAYMRAKREAYFRQQQQYYQQYGNPYQNPYQNPYTRPYTPPQNSAARKPDDPFEEFTKKPKTDDVNRETNDDEEDNFFN